MLNGLGVELDILYDNPILRRANRSQHRIYNSNLGLANLFQFHFGGEGFAVDVHLCEKCGMLIWIQGVYCCNNQDLRRFGCRCPIDSAYCDFCGNNEYAGTWFLDDVTTDVEPYPTPAELHTWYRYRCHRVESCYAISKPNKRDRYVCERCMPLWLTSDEPGHLTFLKGGHYTSHATHVGWCKVCPTPVVIPLHRQCWKCNIAEFHDRTSYYEGKLTRCIFQYNPDLAVRSRFELAVSSPRR